MSRRAAYFLLLPEYFGRPLDDTIFRALLTAGFEIDVYAPGPDTAQTLYPDALRRLSVDYRAGWLRDNLRRSRWRDYDLFFATCDLPMAFAGLLARWAGRPSVVVCDEIYLGGYEGTARRHWKPLARWAMRQANLTVITDACRVPLQRAYANLPASHPFLELPCCYADDPSEVDRTAARKALGIEDGDFVLSFAGRPSAGTGLDWALRALDRLNGPRRLLVQTAGAPDPVCDAALVALARHGQVIYRPDRLEFRESLQLTAAADAALVVYTNPKPQFQAMGVSSHKLCLSLWLGIPVVATRQPSFAFIEQYECGVLIDGEEGLDDALERIRSQPARFRSGARRAVEEHIQARGKQRRFSDFLQSFG